MRVDETEDSTPTYIPLLDNAAEKIKFSITNPNFRNRANRQKGGPQAEKGKEETESGGKGAPPAVSSKINQKKEVPAKDAVQEKKATSSAKPKK